VAVIAAIAVLICLLLTLWARRLRRLSGLPAGAVAYSDANAFERCETLRAPRYGLSGRPDFLVRLLSGALVPVEHKSSLAPARPYENHLIQAFAYCVLVEENFHRAPPFARIQYRDRYFDVPYDSGARAWVIEVAEEIRRSDGLPLRRSHQAPGKCRGWGSGSFRTKSNATR
jgi:CRISPR-associated exonuclease Cas4